MGVKGCNLKQREGELIKSFGSKGSEDGQVDDEPVWVWMWMKKVELLLLIFPIIEFKCLIIIDNDWSEDSSEGVSLTNLYNVGIDRRGMGILLFVSDFENHQIQVMEYEGNFI